MTPEDRAREFDGPDWPEVLGERDAPVSSAGALLIVGCTYGAIALGVCFLAALAVGVL